MKENIYTVEYGRGLLEKCLSENGKAFVVTDKNIWNLYKDKFVGHDYEVYNMTSVDKNFMETEMKTEIDCDYVLGFGGGVAADGAKLWAEKYDKKLIQIPTAVSVNAFICYKTAVRYDNVVKYEGHIIPEVIYIDFDILEKTPAYLNVSGIGDLLSCLTASYDWKLNSMVTKSHEFVQEIYDDMQNMLSLLSENLDDIVENNQQGIRFIVEAYHRIAEPSYRMKHTMWEDASEHNFFMNLEKITKKPFLHGQVICLGVYLMTSFQDNQHERATLLIKRSGIDITPSGLGINMEDIREALLKLNDFVVDEKIRYSILNAKEVTVEWVDMILEKYKNDFNIKEINY